MKLGKLKPRVRVRDLSIGRPHEPKPWSLSRGNSTQRGYGYRWQQARARHLRNHPLCVECAAAGLVQVATDVDHKVPHRGDHTLFWDESNWQSLCHSHHSAKTARGQ